MSAKRLLYVLVVAVAGLKPGNSIAAGGGIDLQDLEAAYGSVLDDNRRVFLAPRHRFTSWVDRGDLVVAWEPDFVPKKLVTGGNGAGVLRSYPSSDGQWMFYVLGSEDRPGQEQLLRINMGGGDPPARVTSGGDVPQRPVVAPNGQALAFVESGALHEIRLSRDGRWERRRLLDPQDPRHSAAVGITDLAYSPDGTRIAFVSERKAGQSYVVVHDALQVRTVYVDPGVFLDKSPVWSPDGREIAFSRIPKNLTMDYRFTPERTGVPWSIRVADAETGAAREIWRADPGPGSVAHDPRLIWSATGHIVFRWEKTGWDLIYAVPEQGGVARLLTPGEGEVDSPSLSADGRTLVFGANFGDPNRYHVWSTSVPGGKQTQLTSGLGLEWTATFSAGGYLAYYADHRGDGPPQTMIRGPDGRTRSFSVHADTDEMRRNTRTWKRLLPARAIALRAEDGVTSHHVVVEPATPPPSGGYPVIVYAHGGPKVQSALGMAAENFLFSQYAASRGYLCLDINYRGSGGFGLEYRTPNGGGAAGASELKDLVALVDYLKRRGDVNPARIGIMGASYGGHIVGLALTRLPDHFAAGVSLFGVADWVVEMKMDDRERSGHARGGGAPPEFVRLSERLGIEDLAYASSPSAHIEHWRSPALFTIGDNDRNGHVESVTDLAYRLMERGVPVEVHVDPAGGHNVFPRARVLEFFDAHMR